MQILKQTDENYPKRLLKIQNPPEQLYAKGNVELLNHDSIAIIGTRKYTKYGEKYAAKFARELSRQGICIVSGLAMGIDSISHIHSMEEKGKTIAVLGSGLNHIYPEENQYLYEKILENGGCVITEYSPEMEKSKENFPQRNRIVSGLSMGVLMIEARYYTGSSITARNAIKQHKPVFCIPHSLDEPTGYTPNWFIRHGAELVMEPQDILKYYANNLCLYSQKMQDQEKINIPKEYEPIYRLIGQLPISPNSISKNLKIGISEVSEVLCMLELEGYIINLPGNLYIRNEKID